MVVVTRLYNSPGQQCRRCILEVGGAWVALVKSHVIVARFRLVRFGRLSYSARLGYLSLYHSNIQRKWRGGREETGSWSNSGQHRHVPCDGSTQKVCEPRSAGIFLGELNRALTPGTQTSVAQSFCRLNISRAIDDIATSQRTDRHCHACDAVETVSSAVLSCEHFASHAPSPALSRPMRVENELVMRSLRRQTLYRPPRSSTWSRKSGSAAYQNSGKRIGEGLLFAVEANCTYAIMHLWTCSGFKLTRVSVDRWRVMPCHA
jgi:hypothetical protein